MTNLIGQVLLRQFRVDAFVASGGMGAVYRVWDLKKNIPLAMKVLQADLDDDPVIYKSFQREAYALSKLAHSNIVRFYGLYRSEEIIFLLQDYIDGASLKTILVQRQGKPMPTGQVLSYLKVLCATLGYAHFCGLVHCDVKPGNVMVDPDGKIFLTDFGIARYAESTTTTLAGAGSPAYMAPEQILGDQVSAKTDIYALGVVCFEMITGRRPFLGGETDLINLGSTPGERVRYAHQRIPPPDPCNLNPSIPPDLGNVILKALSKKPTERFDDMHSFFLATCESAGVSSSQVADRVQKPLAGQGGESNLRYDPLRGDGGGQSGTRAMRIALPFGILATLLCLLGLIFLLNLLWSDDRDPNRDILIFSSSLTQTESVHIYTPVATNSPFSTATAQQITQNSQVSATPNVVRIIPTDAPHNDPTDTSIPVSVNCPGAIYSQIFVGMHVIICTKYDGVKAKLEPISDVIELFKLYPNNRYEMSYMVVDGPVCESNATWWQLLVTQGTIVYEGPQYQNDFYELSKDTKVWVKEGSDNIDPYFICPK